MKRTSIEVYALAVCFVTLICFVVTLGMGIYDVIRIADPGFTMSTYNYERHQSNEAFLNSWPKGKPQPRADELTTLREESYKSALRSEKRGAVQSLTMALIVLIIDMIVFAIHWLIAKRARSEAGANSAVPGNGLTPQNLSRS
jgi:hypothetical protein